MNARPLLLSLLAAISMATAATAGGPPGAAATGGPGAVPAAPTPKTIGQLRKEADEAFRKKQNAEARELAMAVRVATNATPGDFCWAWTMEAKILDREGKKAEARAMYEKLFNVTSPADAIWAASRTFGGLESGRLFTYLDNILEGGRGGWGFQPVPLTDKEKLSIWDKYAYEGYMQLDPAHIRKGREMSFKLGGSGGAYSGRLKRALEVWDDLEHFPVDEKDVKFPKTLEDFGIKVWKTVHVAKDFGFDPVNATAFLQAAITSGAQRVVIENVGKPWYTRTIRLPSNIEIVLEKGVRLHTDRTWDKFVKGGIFVISGVSNVVVRGEAGNDHDSVISQFHDMLDRARHCRDYGSSGILVADALHIAVRDLRIADCAEDGIAYGGMGFSSDMYFENLDLDSNFRQAASLCNINRGFFRRVRFRNTAGSEPGAGIDLEPAELCQANSSIYLYDCTFENNLGGGLLFSTSSCLPITLHAKRCVFKPNRHGDVMVMIRIGPYVGRGKTVPGKAIFEDCDFQGYSDISPVRVDSLSLLDLEFRNCRITDIGSLVDPAAMADAAAIEFNLNRDVRDQVAEATVSFENCTVTGYTNAPPVSFRDNAGFVSVKNIKGVIDFNGEKVDLAKFRHIGPETVLKEVEPKLPDLSGTQVARPAPGVTKGGFSFRWSGAWWAASPVVTYLFHGEKGAKARLVLRYGGNPGAGKAIRLVGEDGTATGLGEYAQGDNEIAFSFPQTGWYSLCPPRNHVLLESEGVAPVYFGGPGGSRESQIEAPMGYVGYFLVPAKGEATLKVVSGAVTFRDASGEPAGKAAAGRRFGAAYTKLKSKSGNPEVWSFALEGNATIKFFTPFAGLWADTPEAVPAPPDAIRSPVVAIERKAEVKEEVVETADLKSFLAAHPVIAKIVKYEMADRLEWAKKGDYATLLKAKEAQIEKMRASNPNEQQQKEIDDLEKSLPPFRERADMEKRILEMKPDALERYAFCQAFAVVRGVYYDKGIGANFLRCLRDRDDMPAKYPEVYWWIYKKDYDDYIRGWVAEFGLGFRDFTLVCDDDKKLDKLIPILEKYLMMFMIDE